MFEMIDTLDIVILSVWGAFFAVMFWLWVRQTRQQRKKLEHHYSIARERAYESPVHVLQRELGVETADAVEEFLADLGADETRLRAIEEELKATRYGSLSNYYGTQIDKYQVQTRRQANWSFAVALATMTAGLLFVFWGGSQAIAGGQWDRIAAGSVIAAIGGGVSAYITKTFLDVHKLSLNQLNRYFHQPVVNEHVLTAQRLADGLDDTKRQEAYESIITSVNSLIGPLDAEQYQLSVPSAPPGPTSG